MFIQRRRIMADHGSTDRVRRYAAELYILPARKRGEKTITIHSGKFGKSLVENKVLPPNRFPIICNALRSKRFLEENDLTLEEVQGPPSGRSSTVSFNYRIDPVVPTPRTAHARNLSTREQFMKMRGILKETYAKLGGAEEFHRRERESWDQ